MGLRLFFLTNHPGATFIPDSRVYLSLQQHTVQQFSTCCSAAAAILFPDPGIYATALVPLITMIFIYIQGF